MGNDFSSSGFSPSLPSMSPHDMTTASHVNTMTTGPIYHQQHHMQPGPAGDMGRLGLGGMFHSDDPLAYPNQPRDFNFQHTSSSMNQNSTLSSQQQQNDMNFFPPNNNFIEADLMGPLPPYLMQNQSQVFEFPPQMYSDPMFVPMQPPRPPPQAPPAQRITSLQQRQLAAHQRQHETTLESFANTPWSGIFPHLD